MRNDDPTTKEMLDYLSPLLPEAYEADLHEAIYWFAADYHGGQWSNLYSALCSALFRPGPIAKHVTKGEGLGREAYALLVEQFAPLPSRLPAVHRTSA
jgi:hypothetical protein